MLLHAAFDFAGSLREIAIGAAWPPAAYTISGQDALVNILLTAPLLFYGLFILRKSEATAGPGVPAQQKPPALEV